MFHGITRRHPVLARSGWQTSWKHVSRCNGLCMNQAPGQIFQS